MIKLAKKQLSRIAVYLTFISFLFILIPIFFFFRFHLSWFDSIWIFYFPNLLVIYLMLRGALNKRRLMTFEIEELNEKMGIAENQIQRQKKLITSTNSRIERYRSLEALIERMNRQFDLETIISDLLEFVFEFISQRKGNCIFYMFDVHGQKLNLHTVKREDPGLVIKAKQGDLFDYWVLRQNSSLIVEDTKKDFRFDLENISPEYLRPIRSLISAPLSSQLRTLGIIRLDSSVEAAYNQDDLRFLDTISGIAAVAIENALLFKETQQLAIMDGLTSCFTKSYFLERLKEEIIRGLRKSSTFSLLMVDIDHFKEYNDKFGHIAGDIVLRETSGIMKSFFDRHNGQVGRFGGEEFCIILPDTDKKEAVALAEELRKQIQDNTIILRQKKTLITISIGIATYPGDGSDAEELMRKSNVALYQAKEKGRNRVCSI